MTSVRLATVPTTPSLAMQTYPEHPPVVLMTEAQLFWGTTPKLNSEWLAVRVVLAKVSREKYGLVVAGDAHEPRLKPLLSVVIDDSFHFHADDLCSTVGIRTSDSYEAKTVDCALRFARPLDFMEFVHIVVSAKLQAAYATSRMQHQLEAVYTQLVPGVELANIVEVDT